MFEDIAILTGWSMNILPLIPPQWLFQSVLFYPEKEICPQARFCSSFSLTLHSCLVWIRAVQLSLSFLTPRFHFIRPVESRRAPTCAVNVSSIRSTATAVVTTQRCHQHKFIHTCAECFWDPQCFLFIFHFIVNELLYMLKEKLDAVL